MAKIIVFVPSSRMLRQAEDIIRERHIDARAISTDSEHILGILEKERERLQVRKVQIAEIVPKLQLEDASLDAKLAAVDKALEVLAVAYEEVSA